MSELSEIEAIFKQSSNATTNKVPHIHMKKLNWIVLGITLAFVGYCFYSLQVPAPLSFKDLTPQAYLGLIAWLLAVALFAERAVEVVVMIFRDQEADMLNKTCEDADKKVENLSKSSAATQAEKDAAGKAAIDAHNIMITYRANTKEIALLVSFTLGILISLAGVRALHELLSDTAKPGSMFAFVDIVTTGLVIAGGSEGIHQMANVFTGFMASLTAQADKAKKQAENATPKN